MKKSSAWKMVCIVFVFCAALAIFLTQTAQAQTLTTLYAFSISSDGAYPCLLYTSLQISPDGRFLLLQAYYDNYSGYDILVFDIDNYPEPPTLVATITGNVPGPYPPYLYYFQVVGNRLFALDTNSNSVLAFNFVPPSNFSQLAAYQLPSAYGGLTVSPDGALIYLPISNPDMITVLDANQLINGQAPLITNIATGVFPYQVAVSPLTAKHRVGPPVSRPPVESRGEAGFTHNSVGAKGLDKTF